MKKTLLLAACLLAATATSAAAQSPGVNLSWDDCSATQGGGINKVSTCTSNTEAAKTMYGSYVLPSDVAGIYSSAMVLDICINSATLPCWWNFTAAPRTTGYNVTHTTPCAAAFGYWASIPGGVSEASDAVLMPSPATPKIRIRAVCAVDEDKAQPVAASVGEIHEFTLRITHDATVGCAGCLVPAKFTLQVIRLFLTGQSGMIELTTASSRNHVFWNGGPVQAGCVFTPAVNRTWGEVKALYR